MENNVKTLEEKIKVMQACLEGKPIEMKLNMQLNWSSWSPTSPPNFNWEYSDYRIKEEPKKKVKLYQALIHFKNSTCYSATGTYYKTIEQAMYIHKDTNYEVIKLLPYTEIEVEID